MTFVAASAFACSTASPPTVGTSASSSTASGTWGIVLGHLTNAQSAGPVNLSDQPDTIACDVGALGAGWVRLEVNRGEEGLVSAFQAFASAAHQRGLGVLLLRQPSQPQCGPADDGCRTAWADGYAAEVRPLLDAVQADALEIGNEPNGGYAIDPLSFGQLLTRAYADLKSTYPAVTFVSGGILNAYLDEPYVGELLQNVPSPPPFDAFGIHPYQTATFSPGNVDAWVQNARSGLQSLHGALTDRFGAAAPPVWATEIGFASTQAASNVAGSLQGQAALVGSARQAVAGLVDVAFWYDYRDDEPSAPGSQGFDFGLRASSANGYVAKPAYAAFAHAQGGAGETAGCYGGGAQPSSPQPSGALSCGALAAQNGWSSPLCDNGTGICENIGTSTSDCGGGCCDASMVHCGTLQRVFGWGSSATCDQGAGECGGSGVPTIDCSGGCCQR